MDIMGTHPVTKFHEDWAINLIVASRKKGPIDWKPNIIKKNLLTKFHEDPAKKLAWKSIKLGLNISKKAQNIIGTNLLTKFHEDWTINVASRGKCPTPGGHVFKATKTIFKLIQDIIGTNLLTIFHDDPGISIDAESCVLTRAN
ncbi:hypothetical protein DPMN_126264 [Dreissena polymorpha]|uniref:Uncharacterized protein n=1 Tax=Dreissena polymorpha TaxID=45954 RepID=A0A9D4GZ15_DREPO|nr:hypothetical protein DPMN_126264 [Dreissena polymorpha]